MKKKIEKFEELIAWQKARKLTARICEITNEKSFTKDYGLKDQVRRAAVSSMSNLAEGFERGSLADFSRFLSISKGLIR
jgi:four helix bundle protein